jgi:hypothetical protein
MTIAERMDDDNVTGPSRTLSTSVTSSCRAAAVAAGSVAQLVVRIGG